MRGHLVLGHVPLFRRDPLALLTHAAREGDFVPLRLPHRIYLLNETQQVQGVLGLRSGLYRKGHMNQRLRVLLGDGLVTSEGAYWKRQRKLIQPFFGRQALESLAPVVVRTVATRLPHFGALATRGEPLDLYREMTRLTASVIGHVVMGREVSEEVDRWHDAVQELSQVAERRVTSLLPFPQWIPTPLNRRVQRCRTTLHGLVKQQIDAFRRTDQHSPCLLDHLLTARDGETPAFTREQVRDQALTLLLAGHVTTATALTWAIYLLCTHPGVQAAAGTEARQLWNEAAPRLGQVEQAPLTMAVFSETLRLYPPALLMSRQSLVEDVVMGRTLPAGTRILVSPYLLHRHPRYWDQPTKFRPERFLPGGEGLNNVAYVPFGSGPRACIGAQLAGLEARVILAALLSQFSIQLAEDAPIAPKAAIALRPSTEVRVLLTPRDF